jgi:AAHS family 3-hydroxyphenylpropionic acid transporter
VTQAEAASLPGQREKAGAVAVVLCFLVAMLEGFDIQAIGLVARKLAEVARLDPEQLGFVFSMANVGLVIGAAFGGWLADKIGRKPVFLLSVIVFGVFTLATTLASEYTILLIVRVLTGFGLGAALPNMMAIASEVSRPDRKATTATMIFCGMPLGGALSSIFVANLPADFDWRAVFVVGGIVPLVVAVLIFLFMRETRAASAAGAAGQVSITRALFGDRRALPTLLIWLMFFPTLMILYILLNWLPSFAVDKGFAKPLDILLLGLKIGLNANFMFNFASVAGALIIGAITDRIGFRWPVILAYVGLLASLLGLAQAMELPMLLAYSGLAGFFILGAQYALYGVSTAFYPASVRGVGSGFAVAVGRIGAILGPIVAGMMLSHGFDANQTILALAPLAAIAGVAVFLLSFQTPATD